MFDSRLLALASCSVIPKYPEESRDEPEHAGGIIFDPFPSIVASNDLVLSHELCHLLAGKRDYDIFLTALMAKNKSEVFKFILNLLYDWYHEITHEDYSPFLAQKVQDLHEVLPKIKVPKLIRSVEEFNFLLNLYSTRSEKPEEIGVRNCHDLVFIADKLYQDVVKRLSKKMLLALADALGDYQIQLKGSEITGAGSSTYGAIPVRSNFYARTVAKYGPTIDALRAMWVKNKFAWVRKHHGEIDWKNLTRMFMGEKLSWPVFLILSKIILKKKIYLVVDRSSSTTSDYKNTEIALSHFIMELSVIIAESLRLCEVPIVVVDIGVQDKIVNPTGEIHPTWFTPMGKGGTPMGAVCQTIQETDPNSMLVIVTDGEPDNFVSLKKALACFPGDYVTFVIGPAFASYAAEIPNVVAAEPNTILYDLKAFVERGGSL